MVYVQDLPNRKYAKTKPKQQVSDHKSLAGSLTYTISKTTANLCIIDHMQIIIVLLSSCGFSV